MYAKPAQRLAGNLDLARVPTAATSSTSDDPPTEATIAGRRRLRLQSLWLVALIGWASAVSPLVGCVEQRRDVRAAGLIAEADWPKRITAGLKRTAAHTPAVLLRGEPDRSRNASAGQSAKPGMLGARVVRCEAHGLGIVLELEPLVPGEPPGSSKHTELVFVSFSALTRDGTCLDAARLGLPSRIGLRDVRDGVRWRLYEPRGAPARGLIVHLGGNKYVRRALLKQGWTVLNSSGTGRYSWRRESPQVFEIGADTDLQELGAQIGAIFDDELADWPYSLEAVLEYLAQHRLDVPQEPAVVMGFSIGALGLPTVVARMPERFEAAVIVAGGANLLEIAQRSRKANTGIELEWSAAKPTKDDWQRLFTAYLESTKLDPYHTAAALTNLPVLMIHAHYDQVVPAVTGESLYARLGKPKRLVFPVGHRHLLRIVMRLQAARLVEWTEAAVFGRSGERQEVG
jgi:pimeloyl-ACP methyl ester carboxylesterase